LLPFSSYRGIDALTFADAAAPGLALGQAIGRWGNYFNQDLSGRPSDLPWTIYIEPHNQPAQFADAISFHSTFIYEARWNVLVCLVLLWVARRFSERLKAGDVFMPYVSLYSVGRFLVETVRGNLFVSGALTIGFALLLRHSRSSQGTKGCH
jgi:phosphatidylglycerol:prolipoprotein diacylglycerol transferase